MMLHSLAPGNDLQCPCAWKRTIGRQLVKIRFTRERLLEQGHVAAARDLDRTEAAQMLGDILRVEQFEPAHDQARHQMHKRYLGRIADAVKHALAEKRPAQIDAVESTGQIVILPDLDTVRVSELVQADVKVSNPFVDPGVVASFLWRSATGDDRFESLVDRDRKGIG